MKLYILARDFGYDGLDILGVFTSPEKAKESVKNEFTVAPYVIYMSELDVLDAEEIEKFENYIH